MNTKVAFRWLTSTVYGNSGLNTVFLDIVGMIGKAFE